MTLLAIKYERGSLEILDQLKLPHESVYVAVKHTQDGWQVIRDMQVRGAPAIAIVAALSLAVEIGAKRDAVSTAASAASLVVDRMEYLKTSRPTAVNLFRAADEIEALARQLASADDATPAAVFDGIVAYCENMLVADVNDNRAIGKHGAAFILARHAATQQAPLSSAKLNVLTHCNTGSLATAGYGTALGVIRALHSQERLECAYHTETRPYCQGARLTAYELVFEEIPCCLIADSMASALMQQRTVSAVVVGADRVAANGDTANKIGTLQLAIAAHHFGVPFLVAAPITSIDLHLESGASIVIEQRKAQELTCIAGTRIAAEGVPVWNPAFDVTPAALITAIITEKGVIDRRRTADDTLLVEEFVRHSQ